MVYGIAKMGELCSFVLLFTWMIFCSASFVVQVLLLTLSSSQNHFSLCVFIS